MSDDDSKPIKSNYYMGRTTTPEEQAVNFKPKLIDAPIVDTVKKNQGSKWNAARTFETVNFLKHEIEEVVSKHYLNLTFKNNNFIITIKSIDSITGDASVSYTRGNKVATCELTIKLEFTAQLVGSEDTLYTGTITLKDADNVSLDDFPITHTFTDPINDNNHKLDLQKLFKSQHDHIRNIFGKIIKDFAVYEHSE